MPLPYDCEDGGWGRLSEGWPETNWTIGKQLLCAHAGVVPYGSYVIISDNYPSYEGATIRTETVEMRDRLDAVYDQMFVRCSHLIRTDPTLARQ